VCVIAAADLDVTRRTGCFKETGIVREHRAPGPCP
jgi:hypothetical protein